MAHSIARANPPDYLTNDHEPAVRASELASPFTEFVTSNHPHPWEHSPANRFSDTPRSACNHGSTIAIFKTAPVRKRPLPRAGR